MTKPINEYTMDELSAKIEAIKAEREKTANALKRYEEELERRKHEVPLGVPLGSSEDGEILGTYYLCFTSDKSKRVFDERLKNYVEALQKLAKGEPIDIQVLLPLMKKGWVAMDEDNTWFWYPEKPEQTLAEWVAGLPAVMLPTFNIKPADDWKTSLQECGL